MKRIFLFCMAVIFLLDLAGCHRPEQPASSGVASTSGVEADRSTGSAEPDSSEEELQPAVPVEPEDGDFVRIQDYIPTARVELAYATANNFTGCRIYDFTDAYLRYGTVKKLQQVSRALAEQGIGLIIWDGFRPVAAQARLWEICPDPSFVSHPVTGKRTHCRGNTVDLTLYALETGEALAMPTGYDNFTAYADRDYSDCSPDTAGNARLLEQTMEQYGFTAYFAEWWHFTDTTDYPVEEHFEPAVPTAWIANCSEYISLRATPGGEAIARIPKGASMELQGWEGKYAAVRYDGRTGYVLTNYIMPEDDSYLGACLDTVQPTNVYSYEQMTADMELLQRKYPNAVSVSSIGTTALGREIPVLRIGDENAKYHVLLQGAIHGREHLTAWLLMAMADYWLDHGIQGYGDVCYHVLPMANPDGVVIAQSGTLNAAQYEIYLSDREKGYTDKSAEDYAVLWKANGEGVDINRNFPSGWELIDDRTEPSSQQYRGEAPFSTAEAAALRDYTLRNPFDATISYHATGSLIYCTYGEKEDVNAAACSLGEAVREISGYEMGSSSGIDGAGYKDWAIDALEIPSVTIEIGCEEAPLARWEIYSVFVRNYRLLPAVARWLQT